MFRIPPAVLTEKVILQPAGKNGLGGIVIDEDDPVEIWVSIQRESEWKMSRSDSRTVGSRGSKLTSKSSVGLIMDKFTLISNTPIPVGSMLELSDGTRVEVKKLETFKVGRMSSGFRMECW